MYHKLEYVSVIIISLIIIIVLIRFIATFHVQHFTLDVLSDTTVQLTCFFAVNSSADGCNVTFNSINQSVLVSVFIPKDNTIAVTNYTGIPEGDSVVNVYDVVEGVISDHPAISGLHYTIQYPTEPIGKFTISTGMFCNEVTLKMYLIINIIVVILQVSNRQQLITTISLITTQPSITVTVINTNNIG